MEKFSPEKDKHIPTYKSESLKVLSFIPKLLLTFANYKSFVPDNNKISSKEKFKQL